MAWIVQLPPSPRHPKLRWQVRYRDPSGKERSAGIYKTPRAAETARKRIARGLPPVLEILPTDDVDAGKAQIVFGDYVQDVWWPTWKAQHPDSAYQTGKRIEKRILPFFGDLRFASLDADRGRRLESPPCQLGTQAIQRQQLPEPARHDPQRRGR